MPVSTNVIRQSEMSRPEELDVAPAVREHEVVRERLVVVEEVLLDDLRPCSRGRG